MNLVNFALTTHYMQRQKFTKFAGAYQNHLFKRKVSDLLSAMYFTLLMSHLHYNVDARQFQAENTK